MCSNIIITFTIVYMVLDFFDLGRIVEHHTAVSYIPMWIDNFTRTLYFSAITLLSVGYGDITPFGWSRGVAILEATIGYILPAAITVQYLRLFPSPLENWFRNKYDHKNNGPDDKKID
ncbi:ion channel [Scopulibacillus darangshiensis]|uniref:Ion channel n=2 Tax=Scopulibacillus darangshiensis TaxID=442528 RepID=A0A4V2SMV8_9BACL|nr:ion channel [Scopulibacillus darangshiensis]